MELTGILRQIAGGDGDAMNSLIPVVYDELKRLARSHLRREGGGARLDTTVLVHEAFLKLSGGRHPCYENRAHFFGIASRLMRQVLVDTARAKAAQKRGAALEVPLAGLPDRGPEPEPALLAMDDALRELEKTDPLKGRLIEMRYFGGMTANESSEALNLPVSAVRRELRLAEAWLRKEIAAVESY